MPDLLIEIGVEEIPASVVLPALEQLREGLDQGLTALRLIHGEVAEYGTPRRLAVLVRDVADSQPDEVKEVKGPPASAAYDAEGKPTKAAMGFAAKCGVGLEALRVVEDDKGSFVYATVAEKGQPAAAVIPGLLDALMSGFTFPKTLKWGDREERFCRPVRWLVGLLGETVLDWEFAGMKAGRTTRGHRFLGADSAALATPAAYLDLMRELYVIADHRERKQRIAASAAEVAATVGGRPRLDEDLLEENNFLVEYPTCLLGGYDERYLALPEKVPVTVMEKHQRYFAVEDADGKLLPYFVITRNGDDQGNDTVRKGNEKVIVPRLEDAEFYLTEDLKTPLPERLESLQRVTFMEGMGTLYDKTGRIEALVAWLCGKLPQLSAEDQATAKRAATLSKCDQVTHMVGDGKLAALQGYIGGHYARIAGETEAVAQALAGQYLPVRQNDPLPKTLPASVLAVADRLDTLSAAFVLGLIPKGTRDPQGLRRLTQGLISILAGAGFRVSLAEAMSFALAQMPAPNPAPKGALSPAEAQQALRDFLATRVEAMLQDEGVSYDVVRAVLGSPWDDVVEIMERGRALAALRAAATDFEGFVDTATRPANIWRSTDLAEDAVVAPERFADDSEKGLWATYQMVRTRVTGLKQVAPVDYAGLWAALAELHQPIATLFDAVMINADDAALRTNRLAMMRDLDRLYLALADFREIVQ